MIWLRRSRPARRAASAGFTIIELLVATAVFSVILIVITSGIMLFTSNYYKGVNQSNTQAVARSIINNISQAIQFSAAGYPYVQLANWPTGSGNQGFCVNNVQYSYVTGREIESSPSGALQTRDALVSHAYPSGTACNASHPQNVSGGSFTLASGDQELLNKNMWLPALSVQHLTGNSYSVSVVVAYGDADLLCSPSVSNSCTSSGTMSAGNYTNADLTCKGQTGSQFCAVAALSTVVEQRL